MTTEPVIPPPVPQTATQPAVAPVPAAPPVVTAASTDPGQLGTAMQALSTEVVHDLQIKLDGSVEQQIRSALKELDMSDTNSVIFFGSKAQQQLSTISEQMLEKVKTTEVGPAGDLLNSMVTKLKEFEVPNVDPNDKPGFLARLFGAKSEIEEFLGKYDGVKGKIEEITNNLERNKTKLLTDVTYLDKLYDANLDYFRTLEVYIAAGRAKLKELDDKVIPAMAAKVQASEDVVETQNLRDIRAARDDLERRVHDLLLTRQVTMQSLPSIRLVQENDKSLITKINSTIANTVPLWKQQLAQAITIFNSGKAAHAVKAATDLTNDLLKSNAENLRTVNQQVREEVERGVFDIDTVKQANQSLIDTIQDSLRIADEGKKRRAAAEIELTKMEGALRDTLASASAKPSGGTPVAAGNG